MFREQIRRIDASPDFPQLNRRLLYSLLDPEGSRVDVTQFAGATPAADANGSGVTYAHPEVYCPPEVFQEGLIVKTNARGFDEAIELNFATASMELQDLVRCDPIMRHPPFVDLRVLGHPAQSVSL